jgi:phosphoglycolate phosphatase
MIPGVNANAHFRAVIFDVDGTLFDTLRSLADAANGVLEKAGLQEIPAPLLRAALSEGLRPMFRQALALQTAVVAPAIALELEDEYLTQYMQRWLLTAPLYAHVRDALSAFDTLGVRLAICTNRGRASTEFLLEQAGIAKLFETIVGMGEAPHPKPAADPLLLVLQRLGIRAADALYVGDSRMDAACAQLAQVRFAAHLGGYAGQPGDLLPNVLSFSGYDEVIAWVLARLAPIKETCHS